MLVIEDGILKMAIAKIKELGGEEGIVCTRFMKGKRQTVVEAYSCRYKSPSGSQGSRTRGGARESLHKKKARLR